MGGRSAGRRRHLLTAIAATMLMAACTGGDPGQHADPTTGIGSTSGPGAGASPSATSAHTVADPGRLTRSLLPADLLVYAQHSLPEGMAARIRALPGVATVEPLSVAQVGIENRVITVASVRPASYRRFTPAASAQTTAVWSRVAGGELAITPALSRKLRHPRGDLQLGNDTTAATLHIGAIAPQVPRIDAVVNSAWADSLGMRADNALLVSVDRLRAPQRVRPAIENLVGEQVSVQLLGPDLDTTVQQTAFLTGGAAAQSVGTFTYRVLAHGRIAPDPAWVAAHIRTEQVPILGAVTCHEVLFPQLRAALSEIVSDGLADKIHPDEYAGCYYPRFIAGTTSLSLHSFGIALDLNVPENQRGTPGQMDPAVVAIFKRWGFAWGGDWGYTDPMHFQLAAIVRPG